MFKIREPILDKNNLHIFDTLYKNYISMIYNNNEFMTMSNKELDEFITRQKNSGLKTLEDIKKNFIFT